MFSSEIISGNDRCEQWNLWNGNAGIYGLSITDLWKGYGRISAVAKYSSESSREIPHGFPVTLHPAETRIGVETKTPNGDHSDTGPTRAITASRPCQRLFPRARIGGLPDPDPAPGRRENRSRTECRVPAVPRRFDRGSSEPGEINPRFLLHRPRGGAPELCRDF